MINEKIRVNTIDGFRLLAILSVMLFYFYSYLTGENGSPDYYPYGDKYSFFTYGYLGVQFFFIISGFVIAFTLHRTKNLLIFWEKRTARLLPAMLLCSGITLIVARIVDTGNIFPEAHSLKNFAFSLIFVSPHLLNKVVPASLSGISYLSFSYWSLWPEVQFYVLASITYYVRPDRFVRNFCVLAMIFYALFLLMQNITDVNTFHIPTTDHFIMTYFDTVAVCNIFYYILWFSIGVLMFDIYSGEANRYNFVLLTIMVILQLYGCVNWQVRVAFLIMLFLFLLFIYYPRALSFFSSKWVSKMGVASYSLYLIHQVIGDVLITHYAAYFGKLDFLFPICLIAAMVGFSMLSFRFMERPIIKFFSRKLSSEIPYEDEEQPNGT